MEDQNSLNLMYLNEERIKTKSQFDIYFSRKIHVRLYKLFNYIKHGQLIYIIKTLRTRSKNTNCASKQSGENSDIENIKSKRFAVYTVIFGNYDGLFEPLYVTPNTDYFVVTNQSFNNTKIWKNIPLQKFEPLIKNYSNLEKARFFKTHPHLLFPDYDYSIFVDGNVQIVGDIVPLIATLKNNVIGIHLQPGRNCVYQEANAILALGKANKREVITQIKAYKNEGFPKNFGLFQTNVVVRKHNDSLCIKLMEDWWNEMEKYTKRDQLSFTYCIWKNGFTSDIVSILGKNTAMNPRFFVHRHY